MLFFAVLLEMLEKQTVHFVNLIAREHAKIKTPNFAIKPQNFTPAEKNHLYGTSTNKCFHSIFATMLTMYNFKTNIMYYSLLLLHVCYQLRVCYHQ